MQTVPWVHFEWWTGDDEDERVNELQRESDREEERERERKSE